MFLLIFTTDQIINLLNNYDNYNNTINLFVQSWKPGTLKCSVQIIKSLKEVKFNLNNITYDVNTGIVDVNLNKMFNHSLIHILGEYMFTNRAHHTFFKSSDVSFLGSLSLLNVLTSKPYMNLPNLSIGSYTHLDNILLTNTKFVGGLGYQYISALQTLIGNDELGKIVDYFNYSDYTSINSKLFYEIEKNIDSSINFLINNNYLDNVNNVGDLVKIYQYIIDQNKFNTKNCFEDNILDYNKWLLKSSLSNTNLNLYIRILKDVSVTYNSTMDKPIINLNAIYTDMDTLIKYKIKEFNNFKDFSDILDFNENFKKLDYFEVEEKLKKFESKLKKW